VPTAQFQANAKMDFSSRRLTRSIDDVIGAERTRFVDATRLATAILGDSIATNMFMAGYAAQSGWLPLSIASIEEAIRLNGIAVKSNLHTFGWGRIAAANPQAAETVALKAIAGTDQKFSASLDELVAKRVELLTGYQNAAYAAEYSGFVAQVRKAEAAVSSETALTEAVARNLAKLMAYKDEYEVARLHTSAAQAARLNAQFEGEYKLKFHLAPPLLARKDPSTGRPRKMEFGAWVLPMFKVMAKAKGLRGTALDIFGYTAERRSERGLIGEYKAMITGLLAGLAAHNLGIAVELANLPDEIRGYGYVKDASLVKANAKKAELLGKFNTAPAPELIAAE
jgi:indolepyruvate ferredoxin oxidoreductase